eukprot:626682-Pelagomonas_calceolata.AAC.1
MPMNTDLETFNTTSLRPNAINQGNQWLPPSCPAPPRNLSSNQRRTSNKWRKRFPSLPLEVPFERSHMRTGFKLALHEEATSQNA